MSFTRRLAAGLPAVGVTVLAALAFAGSPAQAATGNAVHAQQPQVMATPSNAGPTRGQDGYYAPDDDVPNDNATGDTIGGPAPGDVGPTRGQGDYSGGESPAPVPSSTAPTTPTATAKTVPPGVSPTTVSPSPSMSAAPVSTTPGGVSAGELPLTGAPSAATIGVGLLMVTAGAAAVWYTRRRRTA